VASEAVHPEEALTIFRNSLALWNLINRFIWPWESLFEKEMAAPH
jgi:hypothetical protein